jgi:hypothetical protein
MIFIHPSRERAVRKRLLPAAAIASVTVLGAFALSFSRVIPPLRRNSGLQAFTSSVKG